MLKKTSTVYTGVARPTPSVSNNDGALDEPPKKRLKTESGESKKRPKPSIPNPSYVLFSDVEAIEENISDVGRDLDELVDTLNNGRVQRKIKSCAEALDCISAKINALEEDSTERSKSLDCLTYNSIKRIVDTVLGEIRLGSNVALADAIAHSRDAIVTGIEKAMQRNELDVLIGFQGKVRGYFDKMVANIVAAKAKQDTLKQLKKF